MYCVLNVCRAFLLWFALLKIGESEAQVQDDVSLFLHANRKTTGSDEVADVRPEVHDQGCVKDGGVCTTEDKAFPRDFVNMATQGSKPGDEFILRERTDPKARSHRQDAILKNKMAAVAHGDEYDESTGRKYTQLLPRRLLEEFTEEEILARARIGGATGPRYSLAELGVTSLEDFMAPEEEEVAEKWQVLLRASAGVRHLNLYELWTSNLTLNDCNPRLASPDPIFQGVYKSPLVMAWSKVHEVRMSIFSQGQRVFQMTFDASRADRLSWFSPQWLREHPFRDLGVEPVDVFSMEGVTTTKAKKNYVRRFYASKNHAACKPEGKVWMMVVDSGASYGSCAWMKDLDFPAFLYSDGKYAAKEKDLKRGDVFMIDGKIKYNPKALKRYQEQRLRKKKGE